MLSPLAALCLLAPHQSECVSLDRVGDLEGIVSELGQQMDQRMVVDPELSRCMLYVRTRNAAGKDVMDHLAAAASAEWDVSSSPWRLTRHEELRRKIRRQEVDWVASQTKAYLDGLKPGAASAADYERDLRKAMESPDANPAVRGPADDLLARLVFAVGAAEIAKTSPYEIRMLSNRPTASESRLPGACDDAIQSFRKTDEALGELLRRWERDQWDAATYERIVAATHSMSGMGRVLLSVYRNDSTMWLSLAVYGDDGAIRSTASSIVPLKPEKGAAFPVGSEKIEWPQESEAMVERLAAKSGRGDRLLGRLLKPTEFDPLRIQAQPGLARMADRLGADVLVPLPDSVVPTLLSAKPRTEQDLCAALVRSGVDLARDGRWLLGSLHAPFLIERAFLGRKDLDAWLVKVADPLADAFRANATLAAASGDAISSSPLDDWYRSTVLLSILGRPVEALDAPRWLTFFLGSLSDKEWQRLYEGKAVLASSGPSRRKWLTDWSNADFRSFSVEPAAGAVPDFLLIGSASFPSGAPPNASLSLGSTTNVVVRSPDLWSGEWMSFDDLASEVASHVDKATEADVSSAMPSSFDLGRRKTFDAVARYSPVLSIRAAIPRRQGVTETGRGLTFANWPLRQKEAFLTALSYRLSLRRQGDGKTRP